MFLNYEYVLGKRIKNNNNDKKKMKNFRCTNIVFVAKKKLLVETISHGNVTIINRTVAAAVID